MAMDWFRSWHGAPTDNKWLLIAKRANVTPMMVSAVFWALLDYASQQDERGSVAGFDAETYAMWAGCDEDDVISILNAMRSKGVISDGEILTAWDKRQPRREDDSSERVRRHRDKKRQSVTDDAVTQCNDTVTQCNAPDKIRSDADKDTETERATNVAAQASPVASHKSRSSSAKRSPYHDHPAVRAYHDLHNRWPQTAQMTLIAERNPPIDAWRRALRAWAGKGYNPNNIAGILEWAENQNRLETAEAAKVLTNGKPDYNAGQWIFNPPPDYTQND